MVDGAPAAFIAVKHFPHPKCAKIKTIHRIVVRPEFQGIGLAQRLMNWAGQHFADQGFRLRITSSLKFFAKSIERNPSWKIDRVGRMGATFGLASFNKTSSRDRVTFSAEYKALK